MTDRAEFWYQCITFCNILSTPLCSFFLFFTKRAVKLNPNISRNKYLSILDMGLCPIAPPKGFPLALWKPSGKNTYFYS